MPTHCRTIVPIVPKRNAEGTPARNAASNPNRNLSRPAREQLRQLFYSVALVAVALCHPAATIADDSSGSDSAIRQGPKPIKPNAHGIGRLIADVSFKDINGNQHRFSNFSKHKALVVAMTGTGCPLCRKYAPSLAAIEQKYRERDVVFVFVNPNESEDADELLSAVKTHGLKGPYVRDASDDICRALAAQTTTEVFVLDAARTLVYRGAVDDQYGFGYALNAPRHSYLANATRCRAERKPSRR